MPLHLSCLFYSPLRVMFVLCCYKIVSYYNKLPAIFFPLAFFTRANHGKINQLTQPNNEKVSKKKLGETIVTRKWKINLSTGNSLISFFQKLEAIFFFGSIGGRVSLDDFQILIESGSVVSCRHSSNCSSDYVKNYKQHQRQGT